MRDIPAEIIQEYLSREYRPFWLLEFTVGGTTFRLTDCDVPIYADGNLYDPRGFKIPSFQYTEKAIVDSITLQIDNLDSLFTSAFVGGTPQGSPVYARQCFLDADYRPIGEVTGPVGYWKLDEAIGDMVGDRSGNNNSGTLEGLTGLPVWTAWGDTFALDFERTNAQRVNLAKPSELAFTARPFAISAWINAESLNNYQTIFSKVFGSWVAGGYALAVGGASNTLLFWVEHSANNFAEIAFTTTGSWFHVLGVWESDGTIEIYLDGTASGSPDSYTGTITNLDIDAFIGAYNLGINGNWDGLIGNVQVFNRDLTATEKSTLAAGGYVGPGVLTLFEGGLDAWTLNDKILKLGAKSEMARWTQRPLSLHSISCRWKEFKGTECTYAGAGTWCDRTYTRCDDLGNAANFGGFRWLPSIMDVEIWWGKVPK